MFSFRMIWVENWEKGFCEFMKEKWPSLIKDNEYFYSLLARLSIAKEHPPKEYLRTRVLNDKTLDYSETFSKTEGFMEERGILKPGKKGYDKSSFIRKLVESLPTEKHLLNAEDLLQEALLKKSGIKIEGSKYAFERDKAEIAKFGKPFQEELEKLRKLAEERSYCNAVVDLLESVAKTEDENRKKELREQAKYYLEKLVEWLETMPPSFLPMDDSKKKQAESKTTDTVTEKLCTVSSSDKKGYTLAKVSAPVGTPFQDILFAAIEQIDEKIYAMTRPLIKKGEDILNDYSDVKCKDYFNELSIKYSNDKALSWLYPEWIEIFKKGIEVENEKERKEILIRVIRHLESRSKGMATLQVSTISAFNSLREMFFKKVYHEIRKDLTAPEKRAFALFYFSSVPIFGDKVRYLFSGEIAIFNPVITGFAINNENAIFLTLGVIFKNKIWNDCNIEEALMDCWIEYLKFYRLWEDITRSEGKERKRDKREKDKRKKVGIREESLDKMIEDTEGNQFRLEIPHQFDSMQGKRIEDQDQINAWLAKFCTEKQSKYLKLHYFDNLTEKEIAYKHNVSQQSVSKVIKAGLEKLRKGLGLI